MAQPGYTDFPAAATTHFQFEYENTLDVPKVRALALALGPTGEQDFATLVGWWGGIVPSGVPFLVTISPGDDGGGANNDNVKNVNLRLGATSDFVLARWTLMAEVSEIFMAAEPQGWHPGDSSGEGLSQLVANTLYPAEVTRLNGPQVWLDTNPRPDWVGTTEAKDFDFTSFGCALLFLYYLRSQLGFEIAPIIRAASPTLEGVFGNLTQDHDAFAQFAAVLAARFPPGTPSELSGSTNPFPLPTTRTLSARRFLAAAGVDGTRLGTVLRANRQLGHLRALLNSDRPRSLV